MDSILISVDPSQYLFSIFFLAATIMSIKRYLICGFDLHFLND